MRRLLTVDPHKRLNAEQALAHPWIKSGGQNVSVVGLDKLKGFNASRKVRCVVCCVCGCWHTLGLRAAGTCRLEQAQGFQCAAQGACVRVFLCGVCVLVCVRVLAYPWIKSGGHLSA